MLDVGKTSTIRLTNKYSLANIPQTFRIPGIWTNLPEKSYDNNYHISTIYPYLTVIIGKQISSLIGYNFCIQIIILLFEKIWKGEINGHEDMSQLPDLGFQGEAPLPSVRSRH
jgi:hypothetical protein